MPTLLISSRNSDDNQLLWQAAVKRGWSVERVIGTRVPANADTDLVLYLQELFAPTVANALGLRLQGVDEGWLAKLPNSYRQRDVELSTAEKARSLRLPRFIKPPTRKVFPAAIHDSGAELPEYVDNSEPVLIAEPVQFDVEYRCFVLDRSVVTSAIYFRSGELTAEIKPPVEEHEAAIAFADSVTSNVSVPLPRAIVLDVGHIAQRGWAVVEANAAWGSGIYGCDPDRVLEVLRHAVEPL